MYAHVKAEGMFLVKDGGYTVAPTLAMPDDAPTESILAFLEAVRGQQDPDNLSLPALLLYITNLFFILIFHIHYY